MNYVLPLHEVDRKDLITARADLGLRGTVPHFFLESDMVTRIVIVSNEIKKNS